MDGFEESVRLRERGRQCAMAGSGQLDDAPR
jgi:hypothetical protein